MLSPGARLSLRYALLDLLLSIARDVQTVSLELQRYAATGSYTTSLHTLLKIDGESAMQALLNLVMCAPFSSLVAGSAPGITVVV
jgi:hypothetical protein